MNSIIIGISIVAPIALSVVLLSKKERIQLLVVLIAVGIFFVWGCRGIVKDIAIGGKGTYVSNSPDGEYELCCVGTDCIYDALSNPNGSLTLKKGNETVCECCVKNLYSENDMVEGNYRISWNDTCVSVIVYGYENDTQYNLYFDGSTDTDFKKNNRN